MFFQLLMFDFYEYGNAKSKNDIYVLESHQNFLHITNFLILKKSTYCENLMLLKKNELFFIIIHSTISLYYVLLQQICKYYVLKILRILFHMLMFFLTDHALPHVFSFMFSSMLFPWSLSRFSQLFWQLKRLENCRGYIFKTLDFLTNCVHFTVTTLQYHMFAVLLFIFEMYDLQNNSHLMVKKKHRCILYSAQRKDQK